MPRDSTQNPNMRAITIAIIFVTGAALQASAQNFRITKVRNRFAPRSIIESPKPSLPDRNVVSVAPLPVIRDARSAPILATDAAVR